MYTTSSSMAPSCSQLLQGAVDLARPENSCDSTMNLASRVHINISTAVLEPWTYQTPRTTVHMRRGQERPIPELAPYRWRCGQR
jgi:hypothetical protein